MTMAEVITALNGDANTVREAFARLVETGECVGTQYVEGVRRAIAFELCRSLLDDVAAMPVAACARLGMPAGATYARGADSFMTRRTRWYGEMAQLPPTTA